MKVWFVNFELECMSREKHMMMMMMVGSSVMGQVQTLEVLRIESIWMELEWMELMTFDFSAFVRGR